MPTPPNNDGPVKWLRFRQHGMVKRYPEPMAHGPEACEPSRPLTAAVSGISLFSYP